MEKLDIEIRQATLEGYEKEKAEYIANYTEMEGGYSTGFFGWKPLEEIHKPNVGEAKWNSMYPRGFNDWAKKRGDKLTSFGQKQVIEKINEIINHLNKQNDRKN